MRSWTLLVIGVALVLVSLVALIILGTSPWMGRSGMMHGPFGANFHPI